MLEFVFQLAHAAKSSNFTVVPATASPGIALFNDLRELVTAE
ncbi:MAG: hypothetical protein ACR2PL_28070 [Dehalococcoidia bacterium]